MMNWRNRNGEFMNHGISRRKKRKDLLPSAESLREPSWDRFGFFPLWGGGWQGISCQTAFIARE